MKGRSLIVILCVVCVAMVGCTMLPTPPESPIPTVPPSPLVAQVGGFTKPESDQNMEEPTMNGMDAELLASVFSVALSLLFSYVPGIKEVYDPLEKRWKQMIMGIGIIVVSVGAFALSCGSIVDIGMACDKAGALELLRVTISALVVNQTAYPITKPDKKAVVNA